MSYKKNNFVYLENEKYDLFKKDVDNNRIANEFRRATNNLLKAKQLVITMTIDPFSKEVIYTGNKALIDKIEEKNSHEILLSDIERVMTNLVNDDHEDLTFSELDRATRKDYLVDESVAKLPQLRINPNSSDWTAVIGRKVVESFMKDISMKEKENVDYNKKDDKLPTWYPKDVKRKYASNMDKESSKKVMNAILDRYPEIEEDYRMHGMARDTPKRQKKILEQTHSDSPSKRLNLMKTLSLKTKGQNERSKSPENHDDLRKKLAYQKIGLQPKEGWNVWMVKKKFQIDSDNLSRKI